MAQWKWKVSVFIPQGQCARFLMQLIMFRYVIFHTRTWAISDIGCTNCFLAITCLDIVHIMYRMWCPGYLPYRWLSTGTWSNFLYTYVYSLIGISVQLLSISSMLGESMEWSTHHLVQKSWSGDPEFVWKPVIQGWDGVHTREAFYKGWRGNILWNALVKLVVGNTGKVCIKCTRIQSNATCLILIMPLYQDVLPEGATLVPILLGVDETCLSRLGYVVAHPLYVTIGNLPKQLCQAYHKNAYVLLAYLPILESSGNESKKSAFIEAKRKLFHQCMKMVLDCLDEAARRYVLYICQLSLYYFLDICKYWV